MWVKIKVVLSDREVIYLPSSLAKDGQTLNRIAFGRRTVNLCVRYDDEHEVGETSYEEPAVIYISDKLKETLLIPESQVYQMKLDKDLIIIGPVIGFLLGTHPHRYDPEHMKKYSDRFGVYDKIGGLIYAFSPKSINWRKQIAYGLYYNVSKECWEYGCFPLPDVIYRRDFHSEQWIIKRLIEVTGNRLFNSYRFSKFDLFSYLGHDRELSGYLPPTELSKEYTQIKEFIDYYGKVILKPVDLSRGRGICIIEQEEYSYRVSDYRSKQTKRFILKDYRELESFFRENKDFFNKYIIQKYLPLARIENSLFDIRVVMQKGKEKTWGCTGIECRVSNGKSHITNISKGGYALSLKEALYRAFPVDCDYKDIMSQIYEFSQKFCIYMDKSGEHFSEFGMDIAIDVDKNLWLIEANVFPSFKGFKTMNYDTYLAIRYKPMMYALSLTDFYEENESRE